MLADARGRKQAVLVPLAGNLLSALMIAVLPASGTQLCFGRAEEFSGGTGAFPDNR